MAKKDYMELRFDKSLISAICLITIIGTIYMTISWSSSFAVITAIISGYFGYYIGKGRIPKP